MSLNVVTLAVAKKYTDNSISGITGTLAGKNCTIKSITEITGGNRVTFEWTADDSTTHTATMDVMNGKGIASISVNSSNHLIITYSDGTTADAGEIEITAAVDSVNGETGDVILTASDVDAYSKSEVDATLAGKADTATTLAGYGITDAYTKTEADSAIETAVNALDVADSATAGSYVTAVSETDGKIAVTKEAADTTPTASSTKMVTSGGVKAALDEKQDTLTFDNAPTANSNNPVKSGGVYSLEQDIRNAIGKYNVRNLIPVDLESGSNNKGASWTVDNGVITLSSSGAVTGGFNINLYSGDIISSFLEDDKDYILTAMPSAVTGVKVGVYQGTFSVFSENATGVTFNKGNKAALHYVINVESGTDLSTPIVIKPMVADASLFPSAVYSDFQPYAQTNYELTQNKVDWESNSILGAHNLLPNNATTQTVNDVTFTVNSDKSVTVSGTASATINYDINTEFEFTQKCIMTGAPSSASSNMFMYSYPVNTPSSGSSQKSDQGSGAILDYPEANTLRIRIYIASGTVISSPVTFYPMIRLTTDTDDTYQPYTMTNQELTSNLTNLIKSDTYTATTNSNGLIALSGIKKVLFAYTNYLTSYSHTAVIIGCYTGVQTTFKVVNALDMSTIASTEVTITYYYID